MKITSKLLIAVMVVASVIAFTAATCTPEPTPVITPAPAPGAYLAGTMTSAQFAVLISNETGTGLVVLGTSPSLTTPVLATATLTNSVMSGTWTGGDGTVTIPAVTLGGTLTATGRTITGGTFSSPTISAPTITGSTNMGLVTSATWNGTSVGFNYMQMTRGDTYISLGNTQATVTHGLGTTPKEVFLTYQTATTAILPYVGTKGATTFTIDVNAAITGPSSTIGWLAVP